MAESKWLLEGLELFLILLVVFGSSRHCRISYIIHESAEDGCRKWSSEWGLTEWKSFSSECIGWITSGPKFGCQQSGTSPLPSLLPSSSFHKAEKPLHTCTCCSCAPELNLLLIASKRGILARALRFLLTSVRYVYSSRATRNQDCLASEAYRMFWQYKGDAIYIHAPANMSEDHHYNRWVHTFKSLLTLRARCQCHLPFTAQACCWAS